MVGKLEKITLMEENFANWYRDIVKQAKLMQNGPVRGTMIIEPYGWSIWESIKTDIDKRLKKLGAQNVSFPLFIPTSYIEKEKDHVAGFAPELATITEVGGKKLDETFAIRPTSEVLFCDYFSRNINTYRDLPMIYNQWVSVVRWEKETKPFLRSTEFHWQEGHSVHKSKDEALKLTLDVHDQYVKMAKELLAIPMFKGKKTEKEKFAGAVSTFTIEAMMKDGKALQSGTSHYFGLNFSKPFDIKFQNVNNSFEYAYQTSWGISTRIIGAIIMVHSDNKGLVLPPKVAPIQVIINTIMANKDERILNIAKQIREKLSNFKVKINDSNKGPGFKAAEAEIKGIPIRIELGPRDLDKNEITIANRVSDEKIQFNLNDDINIFITNKLEEIQEQMYNNALRLKEENTKIVRNIDELLKATEKGYAIAPWDGSSKTEEIIKEKYGITSRCILENNKNIADEIDIVSQDKAKYWVYFAKAY